MLKALYKMYNVVHHGILHMYALHAMHMNTAQVRLDLGNRLRLGRYSEIQINLA